MPDDRRLVDLPLGNEAMNRAQFRAALDEINAKAAGALEDTFANRPAATALLARFIFRATDTNRYYWCDGVGWADIGGGAELADSAPPAIGDAGVLGASAQAAREDHTHALHPQTARKDVAGQTFTDWLIINRAAGPFLQFNEGGIDRARIYGEDGRIRFLGPGAALEWMRSDAGGLIIAGQRFRPLVARKTATESVTNSTTLQNDDQLFLPIGANEIWLILARISYAGVNPDIKIDWSMPVGGSFARVGLGPSTSDTFLPHTNLNTDAFGSDSASRSAIYHGVYVGGANAGNLQLMWAQNVADANATFVYADSFIEARRIA